ncbi:MAG TPA: carotenoid biosynthesis protein [Spirochaetia bacterium]|nr:carotenoid biosynthesis protein [Spirochaetia bacterium]
MSRLDWSLSGALAAFFAAGFAGHLVPATRPVMIGLTPYALLLTAAIVAVAVIREKSFGIGLWAVAASLIGFALEVVGVSTGAVFGSYEYGSVLGAKILGVPPIIGLNWALVVLGSVSLSARLLRNPWAAAVAAGAMTAGFDWVLEPFAVSAGYWTWISASVPLRNFAAWFLIACVLSFVYARVRLSMRSPLASIAILIQAAFFAGLRAANA